MADIIEDLTEDKNRIKRELYIPKIRREAEKEVRQSPIAEDSGCYLTYEIEDSKNR